MHERVDLGVRLRTAGHYPNYHFLLQRLISLRKLAIQGQGWKRERMEKFAFGGPRN